MFCFIISLHSACFLLAELASILLMNYTGDYYHTVSLHFVSNLRRTRSDIVKRKGALAGIK